MDEHSAASMTGDTKSVRAISEAFSKAWGELTEKERRLFESVPKSCKDVEKQILRKEKEFSKSKRQHFLNRIRPYVDGLNRYSATMDVFAQAKPEILSLIWGPIRFVLQALTDYTDTWDSVLDAIEKFGIELPQLEEIEHFSSRNELMTRYLSLIYKEILDFHIALIKLCRHAGWKDFFSLSWLRYKGTFEAISENLCNYKEILGRQLSLFHLQEFTANKTLLAMKLDELQDDFNQFRETTMKVYKRVREEKHEKKMERLKSWLSPFDFDSLLAKVDDSQYPGTCEWIRRNKTFLNFKDGKCEEDRILWITGHPGAGKTHMCAYLINLLSRPETAPSDIAPKPVPVLYAFPSYGIEEGNTALSIYKSLVYQTFEFDKLLPEIAMKRYESSVKLEWSRKSWMREVLESILAALGDTLFCVVLDGLDECSSKERSELASFALKLRAFPNARILLSSRREIDLISLLDSKCETISLDQLNSADIFAYARGTLTDNPLWASAMQEISSPDTKQLLESLPLDIAIRSKGLFLYARLVVESILDSSTIAGVIKAGLNLPDDLKAIYSRIQQEIEMSGPARRLHAQKIFSWLCCAKRPLTTSEVKQALNIDAYRTTFDENAVYLKGLKEICGCFIEETADSVNLIHYSAKEYLTLEDQSGPFLDLAKAKTEVSVGCLAYLGFEHFNASAMEDDAILKTHFRRGWFELYNYASSYWIEHLAEHLAGHASKTDYTDVTALLKNLFTVQRNADYAPNDARSDIKTEYRTPKEFTEIKYTDPSVFETLQDYLEFHWKAHMTVYLNADPKDDPLSLTAYTRRIEQLISELLGCSTRSSSQEYRFRCPLVRCHFQRVGFPLLEHKTSHVAKHYNRPLSAIQPHQNQLSIDCTLQTSGVFPDELDAQSNHLQIDIRVIERLLSAAAKREDLDMLRSLLSRASMDGLNFNDILKTAAATGSKDVFQLITAKANFYTPSSPYKNDFLYICFASQNPKSAALAKLLMDQGADPFGIVSGTQSRGHRLNIPLEAAVTACRYDLVSMAMQFAGTGDYQARRSVLRIAVEKSTLEIIELLLQNWDRQSTDTALELHIPLCRAIVRGDTNIIRALLDYGARLEHSLRSNASLGLAIEKCTIDVRLAVVDFLITAGGDIYRQNALAAAVKTDDLQLVKTMFRVPPPTKTLVMERAQAAQNFHFALDQAMERNQQSIFEFLLQQGIAFFGLQKLQEQQGTTGRRFLNGVVVKTASTLLPVLLGAVSRLNVPMVEHLIEAGFDVNREYKDREGKDSENSPVTTHVLELAISSAAKRVSASLELEVVPDIVKRTKEVLAVLLKAGADPKVALLDKPATLRKALGLHDLEIIRLLLTNWDDDCRQHLSKILHEAIRLGYGEDVLQVLIDHGAPIDSIERVGSTYLYPLEAAASQHNCEAFTYLLSRDTLSDIGYFRFKNLLETLLQNHSSDPPSEMQANVEMAKSLVRNTPATYVKTLESVGGLRFDKLLHGAIDNLFSDLELVELLLQLKVFRDALYADPAGIIERVGKREGFQDLLGRYKLENILGLYKQ